MASLSQESDIVEPEALDILLEDPSVKMFLQSDWSLTSPTNLILNPTGVLPVRDPWTGYHLFDAKVDNFDTRQKNFVLSTKLNRVYVKLGNVVPFKIEWDGTTDLFVRALMMFTQADRWKSAVQRCITHRGEEDPSNLSYEHSDHVLATDNDNAEYMVDESSKRCSIKIPLQAQMGCKYAPLNLKFMCNTSCSGSGGINRCPTDVIFTLEDKHGTVLGRQSLGVRICTCPKRDKERDEENLAETSTEGKKVKIKKEAGHKMTEEPDLKRVKQDFVQRETPPKCTFTVTAESPEVAERAKKMLEHWAEVEFYKKSQPGVPRTFPIKITEDIAVPAPPHN